MNQCSYSPHNPLIVDIYETLHFRVLELEFRFDKPHRRTLRAAFSHQCSLSPPTPPSEEARHRLREIAKKLAKEEFRQLYGILEPIVLLLRDTLLSTEFREYLKDPIHHPYRSSDGLSVQIDINIAFTNCPSCAENQDVQ